MTPRCQVPTQSHAQPRVISVLRNAAKLGKGFSTDQLVLGIPRQVRYNACPITKLRRRNLGYPGNCEGIESRTESPRPSHRGFGLSDISCRNGVNSRSSNSLEIAEMLITLLACCNSTISAEEKLHSENPFL